jgi:DNA-binding IclR family transcriptional regulator
MSNAPVMRSHKIVELLAGRFYDGMGTKELADAIGTSPPNISRDMRVLTDLGYAHKLDNGRWSLTTRILGVIQAYQTHYNNLQNRMAESARNITAASVREGA